VQRKTGTHNTKSILILLLRASLKFEKPDKREEKFPKKTTSHPFSAKLLFLYIFIHYLQTNQNREEKSKLRSVTTMQNKHFLRLFFYWFVCSCGICKKSELKFGEIDVNHLVVFFSQGVCVVWSFRFERGFLAVLFCNINHLNDFVIQLIFILDQH